MLLIQTYISVKRKIPNPYWIYRDKVWLKTTRKVKTSISSLTNFKSYIKTGERIAVNRNI